MKCVQDEICYHIQRANYLFPKWEKGQTYFIGKNKNPFVSFFDKNGKAICDPEKGRLYNVNYIADCMIDYINNGTKEPAISPFYHFDPNKTLLELRDTLNHYLRLTREIVFEEVRKDFFPDLPSRHRCIWVIRDDENLCNAIKYWWSQLHGKDKKIIIDKYEIDYLRNKDEKLGLLIDSISEINRDYIPNPFIALLNSIIFQQLAYKAAISIWNRFEEFIVEITPENILLASYDSLRKCNVIGFFQTFKGCI